VSLPNVIGFDIGGANTKAAFMHTEKGHLIDLKISSKYFPVWKERERLGAMLLWLKSKLSGSSKVDCVGVTMTAELADSYSTKREGVEDILAVVEKAFPATKVLILNTKGQLVTLSQARQEPLQVAAANWAATGWMVAQLVRDCIVLDAGSTTISIIPIARGAMKAEGETDLEKLINGELVYTGSLRTNVAAIVQTIPLEERVARVDSELFAQSGDVHLILGNISEEDYTVETADGKGKTKEEAMARLARIVCADTETLNEDQILKMAQYVHDKQVEQVANALSQVYSRTKTLWRGKPIVVVTGLGRDFLARKAAERLGLSELCDLEDMVKRKIAKVSTAVGVGLMAATELEGERIEWML
jgi:probable H4MPT-linked C1 transfer pathway protein